MNLCGGVEALEFTLQLVNALPPLFILPTFYVRRPTEGFLFYVVDLFLNEFGEFSSDTLRTAFHDTPRFGEEFCHVPTLDSGIGWRFAPSFGLPLQETL
jgi:hypothetical protein